MSPRAPRDLLEELRTYLEHFDESGHLGDDADVAEIKRRLRDRIAEVEAQLERNTEIQNRGEGTSRPASQAPSNRRVRRLTPKNNIATEPQNNAMARQTPLTPREQRPLSRVRLAYYNHE